VARLGAPACKGVHLSSSQTWRGVPACRGMHPTCICLQSDPAQAPRAEGRRVAAGAYSAWPFIHVGQTTRPRRGAPPTGWLDGLPNDAHTSYAVLGDALPPNGWRVPVCSRAVSHPPRARSDPSTVSIRTERECSSSPVLPTSHLYLNLFQPTSSSMSSSPRTSNGRNQGEDEVMLSFQYPLTGHISSCAQWFE
jgi:hypothetical protein